MASKYWIKLYHEILHERKMAQLSDHLWRRSIEFFLFAGEVDDDGALPTLDDMAWTLHQSPELIETDLAELANVGIVDQRGGRWFVTNFSKRQAKMDKAEYMRRLRNERQKDEYYQGDTEQLPDSYQPVTNSNTDKIRIDKNRKEGLRLLPSHLATPDFLNEWGEWQQHHIQHGRPLTQGAIKEQVKQFNEWGEARAIAAMKYSRGKNWTGLFEPSNKGGPGGDLSPAEGEIMAHIGTYGTRQEPSFNGETDKIMKAAGGYRALCKMSEWDAVKAIRSAQKAVTK